MDVQVRRFLQRVFHPHVVTLAVGLHTQAVDGRALAPVQHAALQKGGVGSNAHQTAQGVHFPH